MLPKKIKVWISENLDEFIEFDDINLTKLEEEIIIEFDIDEDDFEEWDYSFLIYKYLQTLGFWAERN